MKMRIVYLAIGLLCAGNLYGQTAANASWDALNTLKGGKHGDLILIQPVNTAEPYSGSERCRVVSVGANALTCALEHNRKHQFVLHQQDVQAIYLITKEGEHHTVRIVAAGILGFVLGAAITDGSANWQLAIAGGLIGAALGATPGLISRHEVLSLVYLHPPPYAAVATPPIP